MNEGLIPRRYAKALYKVAVERDDAGRLYDMMNRLTETADAQQSLKTAVANPFVPVADKTGLLSTAAGATSSDKTFSDFLALLAGNRRLSMAIDIARAYESLYRELRGICKVVVTSAAPLSDAEEKRLKKLITDHLNGGEMEYSSHVDPELIGGFTVIIDNERLDASVKNELEQLRLNLLK